jgi:putative PIN family toxin of toxin-antitoxin system
MIFLQAASNPRRVHSTFRLAESGAVTLCVSPEVLAEVRDVLTRPKHKERFPALTDDHVSDFLTAITKLSTLVDQVPEIYILVRDPKDSKYNNLAVAAKAEYLVRWDRHLLALMDTQTTEGADFSRRFPAIRIVDPIGFIAMVEKSSTPGTI